MDKYSYQLSRGPLNKNTKRYYRSDLELMTTHQLREICRTEKIITAIVNPMDKVELIRDIMRYRGADEHLLITQQLDSGVERLNELVKTVQPRFLNDIEVKGCTKIITYQKRAIGYSDGFTIKYQAKFDGTNALIVNRERKLCAIVNIKTKGQENNLLYILKEAEVFCEETSLKNYEVWLFDKKTSESLYRIYNGEGKTLPEKLNIYRLNLLSFAVKKPVEMHMPLAIDFGATNTTAGIYIESSYFDELGIEQDNTMLLANEVNYVEFYNVLDGYEPTPLLPSVVAVKSLDNPDKPEFIFGYEAFKAIQSNYEDEGFDISCDIKRWLLDIGKQEEFIDRYGKRVLIARKIVLREFLLYIIHAVENNFKCNIQKVHIVAAIKRKFFWQMILAEIIPEYVSVKDEIIDESSAVLYNFIADSLKNKSVTSTRKYKALVIDCGGSGANMSICDVSIQNKRISYKIDLAMMGKDSDTNFGGNAITYRILQLLKIQLVAAIDGDKNGGKTVTDVMEWFERDLFSFIDEYGVKKLYEPLEALYEITEKRLPTRFKDWENYNQANYYRVKNNYYFLFQLAEEVKKYIFGKKQTFRVYLDKMAGAETIVIDKWKFNIYDKDGFHSLDQFPRLEINALTVMLLVKGDIYNLVKRFFEPMYESGEINEFDRIHLVGQSCAIGVFRDCVSEFVPGRLINAGRRQTDLSKNFEDLKIACVRGALHFLHAKRHGLIDVDLKVDIEKIPYSIVGYMHTGQEVVLIDGADGKGGSGCISRSMDDLTLQLYLKDFLGEKKCSFNYYCKFDEFIEKTYDEIGTEYGSVIAQDDTDIIVNGEVKFFVWIDVLKWGFHVVPVGRQSEKLLMGKAKFFAFENDTWIENFFDGQK